MKKMILILFALTHATIRAHAAATVYVSAYETDCNFPVNERIIENGKSELIQALAKKGLIATDDSDNADYIAHLTFRYIGGCAHFEGDRRKVFFPGNVGGGVFFSLRNQSRETVYFTEGEAMTLFTARYSIFRRGLRRVLRHIDRELNIQF